MRFHFLTYFLISFFCISTLGAPSPRKVIYDTDLAMDDWFALIYLLKSEKFDVLGVTVPGNGEANCQFIEPIVLQLLEISEVQQSVPAKCGMTQALDGYFTFPKDWRHGVNTFHGKVSYSEEEYQARLQLPYDDFEARDFIIEQLESNQSVEMIAVGPLSNIAAVILKRPDLIKKISRLWIMGGNVAVEGNIGNNPYPAIDHLNNSAAEWNIWTDIEAARIVFESDLEITLVPLDATNSVPISQNFVDRYKLAARESKSLAGQFISWNYDLPFIKSWLEQERFYFWDTLAVGIAMDSTLCKKWEVVELSVNVQKSELFKVYTDQQKPEFSDFNYWGQVRRHFHPLTAGALIEKSTENPVSVCMLGEKERFFDSFLETTL